MIFTISIPTGPILNGTHFIYWGQTFYSADDGNPIYFQIIEQTEFCQDGSFNVFSSAQPYMKRAFATKNLPSASGKVWQAIRFKIPFDISNKKLSIRSILLIESIDIID